jgi:hypothetical protein
MINDETVPSTVVLTRAKSGSASLNARISVGQTKVKSLEKNKKKTRQIWIVGKERPSRRAHRG